MRMASRAPLSVMNTATGAKAELARRFALARQPLPELSGHDAAISRPNVRRFLGEGKSLAGRIHRPFQRIGVPKAKRPRTVMILPGFATHPVRMRYMAKQLERAGHTAKRWGLGFNLGASEESFDRLEKRLIELRRRNGEPVVLLGWSLGGIFARELAHRYPECVAKVITMGSPFSGNPRSNNVWRMYQFVAGHSVDNPPVKADTAPKPPVETVALWSPRDGIVAPRCACGSPAERDRAIALRCTHLGFSSSPEAIQTVLRELDWE